MVSKSDHSSKKNDTRIVKGPRATVEIYDH